MVAADGGGHKPVRGISFSFLRTNISASASGNASISLGPETVPTAYTYSSTTAAGASTWTNWFYFGNYGIRHYIWTAYATPMPSTIPAVWVPTSAQRALGQNAVTLAPIYVYDSTLQESVLHLYVLAAANPDGNNRALSEYNSKTNTWSQVTDNNGDDVYLWGITTDSTNGSLWGGPTSHWVRGAERSGPVISKRVASSRGNQDGRASRASPHHARQPSLHHPR